jgi:hypothetical protein
LIVEKKLAKIDEFYYRYLDDNLNPEKHQVKTCLLVFSIILLFIHTGCNKKTTQDQINSGVEGQVLLGPVSPTSTDESSSSEKPYKASLNILNTEREEITSIDTDKDGRFRLNLKPGEYIISPKAPNPPNPPYPEEQKVIVKEGEYTNVTIRFDSGIR